MPATETSGPRLSIVVPAAQEEDHILPCLQAILDQTGLGHGDIEVIVAANGCTDETVIRSRSLGDAFAARGWRFVVLDIPEGGKTGALNRADDQAHARARAYLDADVVIDADLIAATLQALASDDPVYVTGRLRVAPARSWVSRRYGALWTRLPFMAPGTAPGAGFFAVNGAGRDRWTEFPQIISDDSYVRLLFAPQERIEVDAGYVWPLVEGFPALVRVRRRQDEGLAELSQLYPDLQRNEGKQGISRGRHLSLLASRPVDYTVYVAVRMATRVKGRRNDRWARGRR